MNKVITDTMLKELQERNAIRLKDMINKMGTCLLVHKDNKVKKIKVFKTNPRNRGYYLEQNSNNTQTFVV